MSEFIKEYGMMDVGILAEAFGFLLGLFAFYCFIKWILSKIRKKEIQS